MVEAQTVAHGGKLFRTMDQWAPLTLAPTRKAITTTRLAISLGAIDL